MLDQRKRLPGINILLFNLANELELPVGRLGVIRFPVGWYGYVGSGMNEVEARVRRHLRTHVRPHWHLDYLLRHCVPDSVIIGHTRECLECGMAGALGRGFQVFGRFGSSDCPCPGHLFHSRRMEALADAGLDGMKSMGCSPTIISVADFLLP